MPEAPRIDPAQHPMVMAATARLAGLGGWARLLDGKPLEDAADLGDAELLVAAGVLRRTTGDGFEPAQLHPWYFDPGSLAGGMRSALRRALLHAEGATSGWEAGDLDVVRDQGRGSAAAARTLGESLLPLLPGAYDAFVAGHGRFLDVGVGIGAVSQEVCRLYPGTRALGIDVLPAVIEMARLELDATPVGRAVELRVESVADLEEVDSFDLAWLPQAFVPRADLTAGLGRVRTALRPGGWLVSPICAVPDSGADEFERALVRHGACLTGGGALDVAEMEALLDAAGFTDVRRHEGEAQVVMMARRP